MLYITYTVSLPNIGLGVNIGLLSRKSPEEKRKNKFDKTEKKARKSIKGVNCPIRDLYTLSASEEEYGITGDCFRQWISQYVEVTLPKKKMWGAEQFWNNFTSNCINGLLSFMVLNQYDECLSCCNAILEYEGVILETRIGRGNAGGFVTTAKIIAAAAGMGGNEKQTKFIKQIKFLKAIALHQLQKLQELGQLLTEYEDDYGLVFEKDDEYFNENFKYKGTVYVSDL